MDSFRRRMTGGLALAAGLLLVLPLAGLDPFLLDVLASGFLLASFAGSWDIVGGLAGQISLGHALFFGTAAYACALLTSLAGWPLPAAASASILLSAGAASSSEPVRASRRTVRRAAHPCPGRVCPRGPSDRRSSPPAVPTHGEAREEFR